MGEKGIIASSLSFIKRGIFYKKNNKEDHIDKNQVLHDQEIILDKKQTKEDIERKKLLEEILL
jgi:hypothetical protein